MELTGRHVLAIAVAFFGVIIVVNVIMAWNAISTFPGLDVQNSYVASQEFDRQRRVQEALGWETELTYAQGELTLAFRDPAGAAAPVAALAAVVARPTTRREDRTPEFARRGGAFVAPLTLAPGRWNLMVEAEAPDGTAFRQKIAFQVAG